MRRNEKLLCEKLLQTLTKYDKMKLVYLEKDATYEISRTQ
ncbi:hypothetical protein HMPREF9398_1177 [Streptococcus sanguinis VMC66]|nr:hypothetical protein HMPREF9398_1177 [Streptococcus sanguinis VMC66]